MQTDRLLQNEQLQQRAARDNGVDEGHEGLLGHHRQDRACFLRISRVALACEGSSARNAAEINAFDSDDARSID